MSAEFSVKVVFISLTGGAGKDSILKTVVFRKLKKMETRENYILLKPRIN